MTTKLAVSLPDELAEQARQAVREGRVQRRPVRPTRIEHLFIMHDLLNASREVLTIAQERAESAVDR